MRKIIIEISGGNIQEIYSTEKENNTLAVYVIDWDNIDNGEINLLEEFPLDYISKEEAHKLINHANLAIEKNWRNNGE